MAYIDFNEFVDDIVNQLDEVLCLAFKKPHVFKVEYDEITIHEKWRMLDLWHQEPTE